MKNRTCVTIAENSPIKIKKILKNILEKSDYVEIRFDFLKINDIPRTLDMIKSDLKQIVCTIRPKSEGGKFEGDENERIAILKLIAEYNPFLVDIEFNTIKKNRSLEKYLKSTKTNLLISWHDFKKTPSYAELKKMRNKMTKFSSNVKIVTTAKSTNDAIRILQLYKDKHNIKLIAFSMGEKGKISRILCLLLGSPYTYVSYGKAVAPGQFSLEEIRRMNNLKIQ